LGEGKKIEKTARRQKQIQTGAPKRTKRKRVALLRQEKESSTCGMEKFVNRGTATEQFKMKMLTFHGFHEPRTRNNTNVGMGKSLLREAEDSNIFERERRSKGLSER